MKMWNFLCIYFCFEWNNSLEVGSQWRADNGFLSPNYIVQKNFTEFSFLYI
jgi:hypothetical protein